MAIASHECKPGCYHGTEEISLGISAYPEEIRGRNDDCIDHELRREYREDAEEMTTQWRVHGVEKIEGVG
jgi:hypothetical protein